MHEAPLTQVELVNIINGNPDFFTYMVERLVDPEQLSRALSPDEKAKQIYSLDGNINRTLIALSQYDFKNDPELLISHFIVGLTRLANFNRSDYNVIFSYFDNYIEIVNQVCENYLNNIDEYILDNTLSLFGRRLTIFASAIINNESFDPQARQNVANFLVEVEKFTMRSKDYTGEDTDELLNRYNFEVANKALALYYNE